jgi:oxygen-independent coproporphyrinogen III oxidase
MTAHGVNEALTLPADHVGLYVHVPFCVRKCAYCDFASEAGGDGATVDAYLHALAREAATRRPLVTGPLHSVYIGGGTPTLLGGEGLRRLWDEVVALFPLLPDAEVTIEANPGTLSPAVLAVLAELPVTRVSLGVQSLQDEELRALGRIHTAQEARDAIRRLRGSVALPINVDLMYGLPGQTADSWAATLAGTLALGPEHLSVYSLMLEPGTPLAAAVDAGATAVPGEDESAGLGEQAALALAAAGYTTYEVSNAARPGAHSRHNLGYWLGRDYLGLGAAATSCMSGVRWRNAAGVADYTARAGAIGTAVAYAERLSARERLLERVMLGLRLRAGFAVDEAEAACGVTLEDVAGHAVARLQAEGLLAYEGAVLRLTDTGWPVANSVTARLME